MEGSAAGINPDADYEWLRGNYVTGIDAGYFGTGGFQQFFFDLPPVYGPDLSALGQSVVALFSEQPVIEGASLPQLRGQSGGSEGGLPLGPDTLEEALVPQAAPTIYPTVEVGRQFIDPDENPTGTVFEDAPGGIYEVEREETDWDEYYRRYAELNYDAYEAEGDRAMWDWLQGATTIGQLGETVGWWGGDSGLVAPQQATAPGGAAAMPARVTVDTRTGKITKCKRRRRRKLLTESDFNVLLRVATLPNKENVRIVLGKAIGRS